MPKVGMEPIRRKQIMGAVLKLLSEQGMSMITLDRVAGEAGISKGVVVYYFSNKENLLLQSCRYFLELYNISIENRMETMAQPCRARDLLMLIGQATFEGINISKYQMDNGKMIDSTDIQLTGDQTKKIMNQIYSKLPLDESYKQIVVEMYGQYKQGIVEVLKLAQENHEVKTDDLQEEAIGIMALLEGLVLFSISGFYSSAENQLKLYSLYIDRLFL